MSDMRCPACAEESDIATIHDTLYSCNVCSHIYNPEALYE